MARNRMRRKFVAGLALLLLLGGVLAGCGSSNVETNPTPTAEKAVQVISAPTKDASSQLASAEPIAVHENRGSDSHAHAPAPAAHAEEGSESSEPDVTFTLETGIGDHGLIFTGIGGEIDGIINPDLQVEVGDVVQITLINGDGAEHDFVIDEFSAHSDHIMGQQSSAVLVFRADREGIFSYYCSIPGHRVVGMEGDLVVGSEAAAKEESAVSIVRDPADLPGPLGHRQPQLIRVELETVELEARLADSTTYTYWTFDEQVPGPFIRVRQGDTVEVTLKNAASSRNTHSVDFHAVTGPGGGAAVTQAPPGESKTFTFKALTPGLYVYHCATPMVAHHIASGMYGLILVEPEEGLPPVEKEFYVMQGELYTQGKLGQRGYQAFDVDKLLAEAPEYFVFNGAVGGLTAEHPMQAKVGDSVRLFFGVGGPNFTSSFHIIGEIFDRVYDQASLTSAPLTDVQTTLVPPGGATVVEFTLDVPGRYILVDHALSRLERGLVGFLDVEGEPNPEIFREGPSG